MNYAFFSNLVWMWMGLGLITFLFLLRQDAPYGRHIQTGWGPTIDNRLGWFLMEFTVIVAFLWTLCGQQVPSSSVVWFCSACFIFHYFNRSVIFPLRIRTKGKRMPLVIALMAVGFNCINGFFLGYYFSHFAQYPPDWFTDARFLGGLVLFGVGLGINWHSDNLLIHLRKGGATGYSIPQGGLFRWVSCPNHLGEMIEWSGFALMSWCLPALAFAVWTIANVAPRSLAHHRWYRAHFPDYPGERKALVPFLL